MWITVAVNCLTLNGHFITMYVRQVDYFFILCLLNIPQQQQEHQPLFKH